MNKINYKLAQRENVFYWQTDRNVTPAQAGKIWKDRHSYFNDEEIIRNVNKCLENDELSSLDLLDYNSQTSLGNVNSVRVGKLKSGKEIIIRNHPKGILNGYFYVESLASKISKDNGNPCYDTVLIHKITNPDDYGFQVIEKLPGMVVKKYLEQNSDKESDLLFEIGKSMANLHKIKVDGFGSFDNNKAKLGILQGIHFNAKDALLAGLDFNCDVLQEEGLLNYNQVESVKSLFTNNPLLEGIEPSLIHNDFADWNLLTEDGRISGIIDFDECVGGDPILDIACWSTFFDPSRLEGMLKGYWTIAEKPLDFEEKFELYRLRYVISKMTLRIRRYNWEPTNFMKTMIERGKVHLEESLKYFNL